MIKPISYASLLEDKSPDLSDMAKMIYKKGEGKSKNFTSLPGLFNTLNHIINSMKGHTSGMVISDWLKDDSFSVLFDFIREDFKRQFPKHISGNNIKKLYRGMYCVNKYTSVWDTFCTFRLGGTVNTTAKRVQSTSLNKTAATAFALGAIGFHGGTARQSAVGELTYKKYKRIGVVIELNDIPIDNVVFFDGLSLTKKTMFSEEQEVTITWPKDSTHRIVKAYVGKPGERMRAVKNSSMALGDLVDNS